MMAHMPNVIQASLAVDFDGDGVLRHAYPGSAQDEPLRMVAAMCNELGFCRYQGSFLLNYALLGQVPTYDFSAFINGEISDEAIAGRIVLLGLIGGNEDLVQTPRGMVSGIYFHATALKTQLTASAPHPLSKISSLLILLLLCSLGYAVAARRSPLFSSLVLLLLGLIYSVINVYLFFTGHHNGGFSAPFCSGTQRCNHLPLSLSGGRARSQEIDGDLWLLCGQNVY